MCSDTVDKMAPLRLLLCAAHPPLQADLLQENTASAVAAAMRAVDPDTLGAADAVPLVVALMQYEWAIADKVKRQAGELGTQFQQQANWSRTSKCMNDRCSQAVLHSYSAQAAGSLCNSVSVRPLSAGRDRRDPGRVLPARDGHPAVDALCARPDAAGRTPAQAQPPPSAACSGQVRHQPACTPAPSAQSPRSGGACRNRREHEQLDFRLTHFRSETLDYDAALRVDSLWCDPAQAVRRGGRAPRPQQGGAQEAGRRRAGAADAAGGDGGI
jgi:hypothetical protein